MNYIMVRFKILLSSLNFKKKSLVTASIETKTIDPIFKVKIMMKTIERKDVLLVHEHYMN